MRSSIVKAGVSGLLVGGLIVATAIPASAATAQAPKAGDTCSHSGPWGTSDLTCWEWPSDKVNDLRVELEAHDGENAKFHVGGSGQITLDPGERTVVNMEPGEPIVLETPHNGAYGRHALKIVDIQIVKRSAAPVVGAVHSVLTQADTARLFVKLDPRATGTVDFFDMSTQRLLGTAKVQGGVATLETALDPGKHDIAASYLGDAQFSQEKARHVSLVVLEDRQSPQIDAAALHALVSANDAVRLSVKLPDRASGEVVFTDADSGRLLGQGAVSDGLVEFATKLPAGQYRIVASYSGDRLFTAAEAEPVTVTVK